MTSELLSLSTGCNPVTIRGILSALKKSGVLYVKSGTGGATLAAEPEDITLYRICTAVEPDAIDKMIGIHSSPSRLQRNISLIFLLFIVIIGKNLIQCNRFHACQ